jgi:hypothetical protein
MSTGKHGSAEITISYDDAPGGSLQVVTGFVLTMGGVKITQNTATGVAFGAAWDYTTPAGVGKMDPITLTGQWDDTATVGPHVVFLTPDVSPQALTRTLVIVFGNAKTLTVETRLVSYAVLGKAGALTDFEAVIQPTIKSDGTGPVWS